MKQDEKPEQPALPYSTPLTQEQEDAENEHHEADAAYALIGVELMDLEKGYIPIKARRVAIPSDRDTLNQRRLEAMGRGESPKPWDDKLAALVKEEKELDTRQAAIDDEVREKKQIRGYVAQRRKKALAALCAARLTGLSDETNDLLFALHPRLAEIKEIRQILGLSLAPVVPEGNFYTLPSAKYPKPITLERK